MLSQCYNSFKWQLRCIRSTSHLVVSQLFQVEIWCTIPESEWSPIVYVACDS